MPITLYGIPNCDTVKKARAFLTERGVEFEFIDFRKHGVPADALDDWLAVLGWERLLNRKGNTWRALDEGSRASVVDAASASALMHTSPSLIKRPVVVWADGGITVGFDPGEFERHL